MNDAIFQLSRTDQMLLLQMTNKSREDLGRKKPKMGKKRGWREKLNRGKGQWKIQILMMLHGVNRASINLIFDRLSKGK